MPTDLTPTVLNDPERRRPRWQRRGALAAVLAAVAGSIPFAATAVAGGTGGSQYRTAAAARATVTEVVHKTGAIEPVAQATVAFPVAGTVNAVNVHAGDTVDVGATLASLDTTSLQSALASKKAALAAAQLILHKALNGESSGSSGGGNGQVASASVGQAAPVLLASYARDANPTTTAEAPPTTAPSTTTTSTTAPTTPTTQPGGGRTPPTTGQAHPGPTVEQATQAVASAQAAADAALATATSALQDAEAACGSNAPNCLALQHAALGAQKALADAQAALAAAQDTLAQVLGQQGGTGGNGGSGGTGRSNGGANSGSNGSRSGTGSTSAAPTAAELVADQANVDAAAAEVAVAEQNLAQATIVSPIAGRIAAVNLAPGKDVSASSTTAYVVVVGEGGYEVTTSIGVSDVAKVKVGLPATITADGAPRGVVGKVVSVGIPSMSNGTATYPVTVGISGPMPEGVVLRNGASAALEIQVGTSVEALTVPTSAVRTVNGLHLVTVLSDGKVAVSPVQTGAVGVDRTEIVSGLQEGATVVLADLKEPLPASNTGNRFGGGLGGGGLGGPIVFNGGGPARIGR